PIVTWASLMSCAPLTPAKSSWVAMMRTPMPYALIFIKLQRYRHKISCRIGTVLLPTDIGFFIYLYCLEICFCEFSIQSSLLLSKAGELFHILPAGYGARPEWMEVCFIRI